MSGSQPAGACGRCGRGGEPPSNRAAVLRGRSAAVAERRRAVRQRGQFGHRGGQRLGRVTLSIGAAFSSSEKSAGVGFGIDTP